MYLGLLFWMPSAIERLSLLCIAAMHASAPYPILTFSVFCCRSTLTSSLVATATTVRGTPLVETHPCSIGKIDMSSKLDHDNDIKCIRHARPGLCLLLERVARSFSETGAT